MTNKTPTDPCKMIKPRPYLGNRATREGQRARRAHQNCQSTDCVILLWEKNQETMNSTIAAPKFYNYQDPTSLAASILMLLNGVFGVVCNSLIVFIFVKEKTERTVFNVICVVRAIVNAYILTTNHLGIFIPMTLTGHQIYSKTVQTWSICVANSLYMANEYLTIVTAINRFISLFFPLYYGKLCGMKPTITVITGLYAFRIAVVTNDTIAYRAVDCSVLYYIETLSWAPEFSEQCDVLPGILEFMAITLAIVSCFNIATFTKIIVFYSKQKEQDHESRMRIKKNMWLFVQTLLQDSLYFIDVSFTFYFFYFSTDRLWTFFCGTFIWESLHSLDGFIMIMFNERISFIKKQLFGPVAVKVTRISVTNI